MSRSYSLVSQSVDPSMLSDELDRRRIPCYAGPGWRTSRTGLSILPDHTVISSTDLYIQVVD